MIETLSPGVFIQELTASTQVVQGVTTSNLGIVGWAVQGPIQQATYVGSQNQFTQIFGGPTHNSLMPISMTAFFANGGTQSYVVRVPPSDSISAQCAIQTPIFDQQIGSGNGVSNFPYDATSASTPLLGITPVFDAESPQGLVPEELSIRWRGPATVIASQPAVERTIESPNVTTPLVIPTPPVAAYEGRITPFALATVPSSATPLTLTTLLPGQTQYTVSVVVSGALFSITNIGSAYTLNITTGMTVAAVVAAINSYVPSPPFTASGTGVGTFTTGGPFSFVGIPVVDPDLDVVVPTALGGHQVVIGWMANSIPYTLTIPVPVSFYPTSQASVTDGAGSAASFDYRTGFFTLVTEGIETPVVADEGTAITISYQPATASYVISGNGSVVNGVITLDTGFTSGQSPSPINGGSTTLAMGSNGFSLPQSTIYVASNVGFATAGVIAVTTSAGIEYVTYTGVSGTTQFTGCTGGTGTMSTGGAVLGSYLSDSTGAYLFVPTAIATPHVNARVLATYYVNAWAFNTELSGVLQQPSTGQWGNGLALQIQGDSDAFAANPSLETTNATVAYGYDEFKVLVLQYSTVTSSYQVQETYDGIQFTTPTAPNYFPTVLNDLSQLVSVETPGGSNAAGTGPTLAPMTLDGNGLQEVLGGGGDGTVTGTPSFNTTLSLISPNATVMPRSVIITYTDNATSQPFTITDDGNGNLTGSVSVAAATNTINDETGAVVFTTATGIAPGTFVTAAYAQNPLELSAPGQPGHVEYFGDAAGQGVSVLQKGYRQGTDGTFTNPATYGEEQFTAQGGNLQANYQGLYALSKVDELMQVAVPDFAGNALVTEDLLSYAYSRTLLPSGGDRFIILATPMGETAQGAVNWFRFSLAQYSDYAALYWPWITVSDPLNNGQPLTIPPLGHVAGVYARTDSNRNVGKAPGGTVDGQLNFLIGLEYAPTQQDRDLVYQNKINPLISSAQTGNAVWGVRTISINTEWRYINARRLFMFLEKSIYNSTFWIVFENNGPQLWSKIKGQINGFLQSLYTQGYFAGSSPEQAFFVTVDSSNNTPATIQAGEVIINVGAAPQVPAEFVIFQFQQITLSA